ncbi:hypothetical protein, conserved [Plasmodium gonderi]|uniref:Uncharacterized protein n=1 Tax=Plasmodium gonderi TaxID=77519 RepID=A0A1Y1JKJ5_PLAGO|nr:hypothetical protein, conserved [Plasmodium gonderi]GAW81312.1 hypothetical protein, conserved [Plasmodium gonderi]
MSAPSMLQKNNGEDKQAQENVSLFEISSEENLKMNIINDQKDMVYYYTNVLANKGIRTVKYFDIDITEDVDDINDAFCDPIRLNDDHYEEDYLEFKIKKFMSSCNKNSYAKKILLNDMNITVPHITSRKNPQWEICNQDGKTFSSNKVEPY